MSPPSGNPLLRAFIDALMSTVASVIAGSLIGAATAPLKRAQYLLQTQGSNPNLSSSSPYNKGALDCLKRIVAEEGFAALWKGYFMSVLARIPSSLFAPLGPWAEQLLVWPVLSRHSLLGMLLGGATSSFVRHLVLAPANYAATRAIVGVTQRTESFSDCFVATDAALISTVLYRVGQLLFFRQIQEMNPFRRDRGIIGAVSSFTAVSVARSIVVPMVYPFATVERRAIINPAEYRAAGGVFSFMKKIVEREGVWDALFAGIGMDTLNGILGSLIIIAYDRIKMIMQSRANNHHQQRQRKSQ